MRQSFMLLPLLAVLDACARTCPAPPAPIVIEKPVVVPPPSTPAATPAPLKPIIEKYNQAAAKEAAVVLGPHATRQDAQTVTTLNRKARQAIRAATSHPKDKALVQKADDAATQLKAAIDSKPITPAEPTP